MTTFYKFDVLAHNQYKGVEEDAAIEMLFAATKEPPKEKGGYARCFDEEQDEWVYVADHRGVTYWDTATQEEKHVTEIGAVPESTWTEVQPTDGDAQWDGAAWTVPFEVQRARKLAELEIAFNAALADAKSDYTQAEIDTWQQQQKGAEDILAGSLDTLEAQAVISMTAARSAVLGVEITPEDMARRIIANATAGLAQSTALGLYQGLRDLARAATTEQGLLAISWPE